MDNCKSSMITPSAISPAATISPTLGGDFLGGVAGRGLALTVTGGEEIGGEGAGEGGSDMTAATGVVTSLTGSGLN